MLLCLRKHAIALLKLRGTATNEAFAAASQSVQVRRCMRLVPAAAALLAAAEHATHLAALWRLRHHARQVLSQDLGQRDREWGKALRQFKGAGQWTGCTGGRAAAGASIQVPSKSHDSRCERFTDRIFLRGHEEKRLRVRKQSHMACMPCCASECKACRGQVGPPCALTTNPNHEHNLHH